MSISEPFEDCGGLEYRELMTRLADLVGRHQLPIKTDAADINDILDGDPIHCELARDVVRSIYRSARCGHLDAKVGAEAVFNSLGDIRGRLVADRETDIDQINLLEELGWASRLVFSATATDAEARDSGRDTSDDPAVVLHYPSD